jgi:hypothetical protein
MAFERGTENLLEADVDALVNTVNTVGVAKKVVLAARYQVTFLQLFA